MKMVTKMMVAMIAVLGASCSLVAADQQNATEDIAAFEAGLQAIAAKPKLMAAKLLSATSGTTVYPTSNSDMNKTGNHTTPLDLYFDVTMASVSSATLYLNAYDVDYPSATEDDEVYFNGTPIGRLQGYDGGMNLNTFNLPANIVKIGSNHVHIDVSVNPSGWITQIREGTKLVLNGEEGRVALTVSKDLLNKIELSWSANYSGAAPYNIYRGKTSDNLTIYREGLTVTSFTDTDIVPGDTYYYQIKTMSGVSSTIEEAKSVKGVVTVIASQDLYHKVQLSWTTENCTGPFTIYRGETEEYLLDPARRVRIGIDVDECDFVDLQVEGGKEYYYQVFASNGAKNDIAVKGKNRRAEIDLKVSSDLYDVVKLDWECPVENLKYRVFKLETANGPVIAQMPSWHEPMTSRMSWCDGDLVSGCGCYYYVESELGVCSEIVYGRKGYKPLEPKIGFVLEGVDYPRSIGGIGRREELDVLVAGRYFDCKVTLTNIELGNIKCFKIIGEPMTKPATKKHQIICLVGAYESDYSEEVSGWQRGTVRSSQDGFVLIRSRLEAKSGMHGMYRWKVICDYVHEGKTRSIKYEDNGGRPVYFMKNGYDRGMDKEPNWFQYWREDGACPGLRGDGVVVLFDRNMDDYGNWDPQTPGIVRVSKMAADVTQPFTVGNYEFSKHSDGRWEYGIYNLEDTIAHEIQHKKTYERYDEQHFVLNKIDSDSGVEKSRCIIHTKEEDLSQGEAGPCSVKQKKNEFEICDNIVDDDELDTGWLDSFRVEGLDPENPDSFGMQVARNWWEYGAYGDDEYVAWVAGKRAMDNAETKKYWRNDWAYPGELAGGLPLEASQEIKVQNKKTALRSMNVQGDKGKEEGFDVDLTIKGVSAKIFRNQERIDRLDYKIEIQVQSPTFIGMCGELIDEQGNVLARASTRVDENSDFALLEFDARDIFESGYSGPVTLGQVDVMTKNNHSNVVIGALYDFKLDPIQINREELARVPGEILEPDEIALVDNDLKTTVPVVCNIAGDYELVAELTDTNGNYVARARVTQAMSVGTNEVALAFAGAEIYNSAHDGPYVLSSVQLWSGDEMVDAATDLLTTEGEYSCEDFKPADTVVTVNRESGAFAAPIVTPDGTLGALRFSFDVTNETQETLCYRLSANLVGASGEMVALQDAKYVYLEPGENHLEVAFAASTIASKGVDGPYAIGEIELVHQDATGNDLTFRPTAVTEAYSASDFGCVPVAFSDEPTEKEPLECDTPTVVLPFEAKRACTVVASATLIGTNGEFIARASATNRCDATGAQTAEIVFPREALVAAGQQGPFSVGYFALLPLVDGEEPIYSDTFEVTGVEWIDWEGMFDWAFEGGTAQAALYKGTNGVVRVPSFVKGRDVISVGPCCFLDCECVAEIVLPVGIADVGIGAFFGTSLSAVELPESVATVGNAAFNVEGLELVVFDGPPPMSAPDAYPKGAVGTYSAAYAAAWEAELKGGCLWNGLTMVPEGADADGYRTESGWTVVGPEDAAACEGKRTFRSAETADGASSAMTMDVEEQTSVSFWWKTSCEGARMDDWQGDHAEFLIDGVVVERIAGESCWKQVVVNISDPGQHELSWRYVKDGAGASGADCVWVSDVGFATAAGEMTHAELLAEADYNWFYENGPVECGGETPFEYIPEKPLPERTLAQIDILCDLGIRSVVDTEDAEVSDSAQTAFCRCANGEGLDFAVWTADGWMRVGNALVGAQQGEARVTICLDYSVTPSQFACKVNNHTLTNENGQSSFVCAKQDCRVNEIATDSDGAGRIVAWAGRYDASNSEILEIAEGTEAECDSDLSNLPRETFQVSGGGTLVIKGADVPTTGVKARLHVDQNSALRFDYSDFSLLPSVLTLFSGVGNDFMLGGNVSIVVPGEGTDRLSKLCVKDGNLEAHIAERPEIVTEDGSESPFAIDGENGAACLNVGNAVEGFWYGLLTTGSLTTDLMLDRDSVRQCTSSGVLKLESTANSASDAGFYRITVSAEEP